MRISTGLEGSQFSYISKEEKINSKTNVPEVEVTGIPLSPTDGFPSGTNSIQEINKAILRLMQQVRMMSMAMDEGLPYENEGIATTNPPEYSFFTLPDLTVITDAGTGETQLPMLRADLEEMAVALVEGMNEILGVLSEASYAGTAPDNVVQAYNNGLEQIREIIASALKLPETTNDVSTGLSALGIRLIHDGLLSVDRQSLKEAVSSNVGEVVRAVKTVALNLFETLPLCIDPNSGNLIYIGRRLEEGDDEKASKVTAALNEEMEKERTELVKKLNVAELLISHSGKFIDKLKLSTEMLPNEE